MVFPTRQCQRMSNANNDADDRLPSGLTLIDTDSDLDAFSVALYARLHNIVDPVESEEPVSVQDSVSLLREDAPRHNVTPTTPTFESRIREQLRQAHSPPSLSHPQERSFLDRAEEQLQEHYDRVLADEALCDASGFAEMDDEKLATAFRSRYGVGLREVEEPVRNIVNSAVEDYRVYFEAERDIVESAKHYERLDSWLKHTRDLFDKNGIEPTHKQAHELEHKLQDYLSNTPAWQQKFADAKKKWERLCTSRQALRTIHQLVGGTTGCRICFNKQVKTLLVPCGHLLCEECANRVSSCPFCNTSFYARQNVFFV